MGSDPRSVCARLAARRLPIDRRIWAWRSALSLAQLLVACLSVDGVPTGGSGRGQEGPCKDRGTYTIDEAQVAGLSATCDGDGVCLDGT